jgi:hypothetical protein
MISFLLKYGLKIDLNAREILLLFQSFEKLIIWLILLITGKFF